MDGERLFGDYEEGVMVNNILTEEDLDFIQNFDVVICDVWGKVEGQFKDLKKRGITTAFDCATYLESDVSKKVIPCLLYTSDAADD